jgi:HEPN domain-containing protein
MPIGKTTKCVDIPTEFLNYAEEDERVARMLLIESRYRHCVYFALQAMEKYLRARLFRLVDPYDREVINANRHHLIEVTIAELVKAIEEPVMKAVP